MLPLRTTCWHGLTEDEFRSVLDRLGKPPAAIEAVIERANNMRPTDDELKIVSLDSYRAKRAKEARSLDAEHMASAA